MDKLRDLGGYYRKNTVKNHVLNDQRLDSNFGGMFQHDQARAHMAIATKKLLEEYNINFIG
jgi:hypothetical protein